MLGDQTCMCICSGFSVPQPLPSSKVQAGVLPSPHPPSSLSPEKRKRSSPPPASTHPSPAGVRALKPYLRKNCGGHLPLLCLERSCELAVDCEEAEHRGRGSYPVTSHLSRRQAQTSTFHQLSPLQSQKTLPAPRRGVGAGAGRDIQALQVHCLFTPHSQAGCPRVPAPLGSPWEPTPHPPGQEDSHTCPAACSPSRDTSLKGHSQKSFS